MPSVSETPLPMSTPPLGSPFSILLSAGCCTTSGIWAGGGGSLAGSDGSMLVPPSPPSAGDCAAGSGDCCRPPRFIGEGTRGAAAASKCLATDRSWSSSPEDRPEGGDGADWLPGESLPSSPSGGGGGGGLKLLSDGEKAGGGGEDSGSSGGAGDSSGEVGLSSFLDFCSSF